MKPLQTKTVQAIGQWLVSQDGGTSSETMAAIAMGAKKTKKADMDAPHDMYDFGRCYRLIGKVPEIKEHFGRIGKLVPTFKGILENWEELCTLYESAKNKKDENHLHARIKELRGDKDSKYRHLRAA